MNKKKAKLQKSLNRIDKYFIKNTQTEEEIESPSVHSSQGNKKLFLHPNSSDFTPDKQQSPHNSTKKIPISTIIKNMEIKQILQKCPGIKTLLDSICKKINVNKKLASSILKKYLQSNQHSLWNIKYAPKNSNELFNISAGQQIKNWLDAFFQYKNKICEQQDSFLNDYDVSDERSCKIYKNMVNNHWQLSALVVRGRPGIGKTSAIRAVAHEMAIDLQECGNHFNQTKYLKEKNESTQSESVKTAISKKVKVQRNAQMITKFLPLIEKQKIGEAKKSQMIHNVELIYPENQSQKFYNQLSRCVQLSKIPFIMTNSHERLPRECQKYDLIQFQQGQTNKIEQILWLIYHLQKLCGVKTSLLIDPSSIFDQLNSQSEKVQFHQIIPLDRIRQLCNLYKYRLDYIFTYLQYEPRLATINFNTLFLQKIKKYEMQNFLKEVNFQDFDMLKQENGDKMQDNDNTRDTQYGTNENELHNFVQRLNIMKCQDQIKRIQPENSEFQPFVNASQWQSTTSTCLNPNIHYGIKTKIVKKINWQIVSGLQKSRSTLKAKQLCFLPMLLRQKRNSRSHKQKGVQQLYMKYLDENEYAYVKKYGNLIKQE